MMRRLTALLPILLLAACASQPVDYYRLAALDAQSTPATSNPSRDAPIVLEVKLPDYLNTANIAYQYNDVGVTLAQNNLWAEAPGPAIARLLVNDLAKRMPQATWLTNNTAVDMRSTRVLVSLDQFNGRYDGHAVISGQWLVRNSQQQLLGAYPINIEVTQYGDGYDPLVRALNQGVHQLAGQIATQLPQTNWR